MGLQGFVDIAVGLMLMYLVLSLVCTTFNELIATSLKWRAKSLSKACTQLIDITELRAAFYDNGLIANAKSASGGGAPPPGAPPAAAPAKGGQTGPAGKPKDREHPSYLSGSNFAMALLDSLTETTQAKELKLSGLTQFPSVQDIEQIVGKLPDSNIRDVLLASLATGKKDIEGIRDNIAAWFDDAMDRLSGNYKRRAKKLSLLVGIVVAFAFNADSLSVGRALWKDETLRAQIVNAAAEIVKTPPDAAKSQCEDPNDPGKTTICLLDRLKTEQQRLRPFPIGWPDQTLHEEYARGIWNGLGAILLKLLGCLWTGLALSLGAPFWFDLLQKFINVRGTGPKPEKTK